MTLSLLRFVEPHVSRLRPCILANKVTLWFFRSKLRLRNSECHLGLHRLVVFSLLYIMY